MGSNSPFRTRSAVGSGLLGTVVATGIGAAAGTMVGASQSESEPTEAETPEAEADFGETDLVDFGGFGDF
jgi:hypothetical protein